MTEADGEHENAASDHDGELAVVNPYAGGGGGSTFGHRVATSYLADMLLGATRSETGELPVVKVAFQTNPTDPVDDLRVEASSGGDRVVVHIAIRRTPQFAKNHAKTAKLIGSLLDQVDTFRHNDRAYVAIALTGMTNAHREVQRLASLARGNSTEVDFYAQVTEPGRHRSYANRYEHITGLVKRARPETADDHLRNVVWSLLTRLWVLDFRVESDDESDWTDIANRLDSLARAGKTGADVRNDLNSACATQFDQKGTAVDRSLVRRTIHSVLASDVGRSEIAWRELNLEQKSALVAVRHDLGGVVELPRKELLSEVQAELTAAGAAQGSVLLTGESGTGKSALALSAATSLAATSRDFQFVIINLRRTRDTVPELSTALGMPFADILGEMSAKSRVLIVDAADAALEGRGPLLRELVAAAHEAEVGLALITAETAVEETASALFAIYPEPKRFEVPGLSDAELRVVRDKVPAIAGALRDLPAKSLYRRLAVVDLLARAGITVTTPLDEWACLSLIWKNLISRSINGISAAARTEALLAMSEADLQLPEPDRSYARPDPAALDTLRADLLVSPENILRAKPEFAHDEVRRFATAVRLVRTSSITETLKASGPVRWSMSAAKLACEGKLADAVDPNSELAAQLAEFDILGDESTVRWKDVPLEAVLEMPNAYDLLLHVLTADDSRSNDVLATFVKVVSLHQRYDGMVDLPRGEPVVRLVAEEVKEFWRHDDEFFRLVRDWLHSALASELPAGNPTRRALKELLLNYWRAYHPATTPRENPKNARAEIVSNVFGRYSQEKRRQRPLHWKLTQERYIQLFALLGPDIDGEVRACLTEVATESPSHLRPAVDLDWSAWGLGAHDPTLLLQLTESYYIDENRSSEWGRWDGIRDHQHRGFQALNHHNNGPFWVMIRICPYKSWIPVVNRILNHAARVHCHSGADSGTIDPGSTFTLAIDGTERVYVGDSNVWGWYRGNTNGPYPCMSALQAVERWVDRMVADKAEIADIVAALLDGCENLAMLALVVGASIRHLGSNQKALDPYLVEPLIWEFDFFRVARETTGFMSASNDGITNPERRQWFLQSIAAFLVLQSSAERQAELKELRAQLLAKAPHFDVEESTIRRWAAALDADSITTDRVQSGMLVSIMEPDDIEAELAPVRADISRGSVLIALQNKYWIPPSQQRESWAPPTPVEIAEDLTLAKDLHEKPPEFTASDPHLAIAYIAAAAIRSAGAGHPEALGQEASFAITSVLSILEQAGDTANEIDALRFEYDIGTRGAAAGAIPHLLLPELAEQLKSAGVTPADVAAAAAVLGLRASTDTCLKFAREFDTLWAHPCSGSPCIHLTAYQWALDLGRHCEIGEFDEKLQRQPRAFTTGDVMARLTEIRADRLDTARLSAPIRACGRAASSSACVAETAQRDLETLLQVQAHAMVIQETSEHSYYIDDQGAETITAARALLHEQLRIGANNDLLFQYITTLAPASHVFSAFLRDLAAVGAETQELAEKARQMWPSLFAHAMDQVEANKALYNRTDTFHDYALSHLIPNHPDTSGSLHGEFGRHTFEWVRADDLVELIPHWLPHAAGRPSCLFELIRFLRQLPVETQLIRGLQWTEALCFSGAGRQLTSYGPMNEWLIEIKPIADARGAGDNWLNLVDRLVYAGNSTLAPFSR